MEKIIFVIFFFLMSLQSNFESGTAYSKEVENNIYTYETNTKVDYTYVWVFEGGIWWIYVYDEDGRIVKIYPAELIIFFKNRRNEMTRVP